MVKLRILFSIIFLIFLIGCLKTGNDNLEPCQNIWCADSFKVEEDKLRFIFEDSYHMKIIKKSNGEEVTSFDNDSMFLETNDSYICFGDHESEEITLENIHENSAFLEIIQRENPPNSQEIEFKIRCKII